MAKKQWVLLAVFIALATIYICAFTDFGRHPAIQISHAVDLKPKGILRPRLKAAKSGDANVADVRFNLDQPCQLTEIKVVCLAGWQTNKSILPLWHLISDSNSVPIRRFYYGTPIRGMKPFVVSTRPKPLETNVIYRLFLTAGSVRGQHDFSTLPKPAM
jgi:hypothetical protein